MSFFDVFPFQSHQFFKKYDDFTPEDLEKSIFYGVFSVKTGNSTGFKNKFLNVLNHKMTITSVIIIFFFFTNT